MFVPNGFPKWKASEKIERVQNLGLKSVKEAFNKSTPDIQQSILKELELDTIEEMKLTDFNVYV